MNQVATDFFRSLYGSAFPDPAARLSLWRGSDKRSLHFNQPDPAAGNPYLGGADPFNYFGVGLRVDRPGLDSLHRGSAADVGWLPGLWVDIDLASPAHKADARGVLPTTLADGIDLVGALPHTPTIVVHSGYGLHCYYLFPSVDDIRDPARHALAAQVLETLQLRVIGAATARGLHVDSTYDLARVLRIPGTRNTKLHNLPEGCTGTAHVGSVGCTCPVVTVLDEGGERVSLDTWATDLGVGTTSGGVASGRHVAPAVQPPTAGHWPPGAPPVPIAAVRHRLNALKEPNVRAMAVKMLAGDSFADTERDGAMNVLAGAVSFIAPDNPVGTSHPDDLLPMWTGALAAWAAEPTARLTLQEELAKAADKMTRSQQDARARHAAERAELAALSRAFAARAPAQAPSPQQPSGPPSPGASGAVPTPPVVPAPSPTAIALGTPAEDPLEPYSSDELESIMDDIGVETMEELNKRWIIQRGDSFYVLTHRSCPPGQVARYSQPFGSKFLLGTLRDYLARAGLDWFTTGSRGQPRLMDAEEVVTRYGSQAEQTEAHLEIQRSYYDEATSVFYEAACPLRPITARQHPAVQAWMEALGGPEKDKLLDWVATITRLDMLTCALYLSGPPGTGKSLFAAGLARLWSTGGATELARVMDNFNADLARCPLILADEGLPSKRGARQTSVELRTLIGSKKRTLSRKYVTNADLHGCPRLILTANNERLLAFNEDLEPDDIQAMSERFLHIDTCVAAGHLAALGGAGVVKGWVDNDIIAQHALWLRDTRQVIPGERFLVVGSRSKVHESIATRGSFQGLVTEWLVKELVTPSKAIHGQALRIGGGKYLVNTNVVATFWDQHIRSDKTPETARIGRVLKGLSVSQKQMNMKTADGRLVRVHEIRPEALFNWGVENQLGELEHMQARLNAPIDADATTEPAPTPQGQVFSLEQAIKDLGK